MISNTQAYDDLPETGVGWAEVGERDVPFFNPPLTILDPSMSPAVTRHVTNTDIDLMSCQSSGDKPVGYCYDPGLPFTGCAGCWVFM